MLTTANDQYFHSKGIHQECCCVGQHYHQSNENEVAQSLKGFKDLILILYNHQNTSCECMQVSNVVRKHNYSMPDQNDFHKMNHNTPFNFCISPSLFHPRLFYLMKFKDLFDIHKFASHALLLEGSAIHKSHLK